MLLLWMGGGIVIVTVPIRAYAAISFALNNDGALGFSLVNDGALGISLPTDAEGTVS